MSDETNRKCPEFTKSAPDVIQEEKDYIAKGRDYKFWGLAI